jgi:hypothetical protein
MSQVNLDKNNAYFLNLEEVLEDGYKLPKRKKYVMTWTNSRNKTAVEKISSKCRLEVQQS